MMPYQKFSHCFFLTLLAANFSLAADDKILSNDRLNLFNYDEKKNIEDSSKLRKDWINPINYQYSYINGETTDTTKSFISINQPIFKSGGIYSAIKYADSLEKYTKLDINSRKNAMIKDATILLFNIHIADFNIKKQDLLFKNAMIDVQRKKEQVLNGFLDTSFLDNAILDANLRKNTLIELEYNKEQYINNFNNLASGDYKKFQLPSLKILDKQTFLTQNLNIEKSKSDINTKDNFYDMTISKYLPTFNVTYDYTKYHDIDNSSVFKDNDSVQNYGANITIPLDVRTSNDIQSQKISFLKSKINLDNIILEEQNFYKTKLAKIKMLDKKIKVAKKSYDLYNSLLDVIVEEKEAELKTQSDVDTLSNSRKVKAIEIKVYTLEKQIELLELYSKIL